MFSAPVSGTLAREDQRGCSVPSNRISEALARPGRPARSQPRAQERDERRGALPASKGPRPRAGWPVPPPLLLEPS